MAGSGVKPSSDSALRDASSDSARARISLVASKAIAEASTEDAAVFSRALPYADARIPPYAPHAGAYLVFF